jgi:hypothetical protein
VNLTNYLEVESGIRSLLFSIPLTALILVAGTLFVKDKSGYKGAFFSLLWGTLTVTILFALWKTGCKSIFLLACPTLLLVYNFNEKSSAQRKPLSLSVLPVLLLLSLLFSLKSWYHYPWQQLIPDHAFYSRIAGFISSTGQENEYHQLNNLNSAYHGISPYHYFELWFNGFVSAFSERISLLNYLTITTIHFNLLLVLALVSLSEQVRKIKYPILICLLVLLSSSINIFEWIDKTALKDFGYIYYSISAYNELKFAIPILLIAAFFLLLENKDYKPALFWLAVIPVLNFTLIPALTIAFSGFAIVELLFRKSRAERKAILLPWLWYLFTVAGIFILYQSSWSTGVARDAVKISDTLKVVAANSANLMQLIKITAAGIISIPVCLAFWALPLYFASNRKEIIDNTQVRSVLLFSGLLFIGSSFSWGLLNETLNSVQLFSILTRSYVLLIAILLPIYLTTKKSFASLLVILCIGVGITLHQMQKIKSITLNGSPEREFTEMVAEEMLKGNVRTGFIRADAEYSNAFNCYPSFSIPLAGLTAINDTLTPISLSEFSCKSCRTDSKCRNGLVLGLVQRELDADSQITMSGFCKKYNIGLVLLSPGAMLPDGILADNIKTDRKTGLQLLKIKSLN